MKIKAQGNAPQFVKEYIEFQQRMPQIQMGKISEGSMGPVAVESIPLNSFIAAFLAEVWEKESNKQALGRNTSGQISDEDKMQIIWNTMAGFMETVAREFGWKELPGAQA